MPDLDPVTQDFIANVEPYVAALKLATEAAGKFAIANLAAVDSCGGLDRALAGTATVAHVAADALTDMGAAAFADAAAIGKLSDAVGGLGVKAAAAGVAGGAALGLGAALGASFFGLTTWGNALHWIVMGSLEILSTAVPALVAFGAAGAALYPTFVGMTDRVNSMYTATGSLTGLFRDIGGPLSTFATGMGQVTAAVAPDAWIMLGNAIDIVTARTGLFAGMATQAASALTGFTTKIATELAGPAGQQLAGFFGDAVRDMIQWGQFLGNLGHTFVNVMSAMWGVGKLLLDVLDLISRALLDISGNSAVAVMIGLAAAMSAVYRYGKLLVTIWTFLGGEAAVGAISGMAATFLILVEDIGLADAALAVFEAALGPVTIAIGAIGVAAGIWYLSTRQTSDATTQLISRVEAQTPTVLSLAGGIGTLSTALYATAQAQARAATSTDATYKGMSIAANEAASYNGDVTALTTAIHKQADALHAMLAGLLSLGLTSTQAAAGAYALNFAVDLQDSKVQQLNQAWDAYMGIVTGGTGGLAGLATAMQNMTQISSAVTDATTGLTQTGTVTDTLQQFQAAMAQGPFGAQGASAWTNFDSLMTGPIQQMGDWLQTALAAHAITSGQFKNGILDLSEVAAQYTGNQSAANAQVLAFSQRSGVTDTNIGQLATQTGGLSTATAGLTTIVNAGTGALSGLQGAAAGLSNVLKTQVDSAMIAGALKVSGYDTALQTVLYDMQHYGPNSQITISAIQQMNQDYQQAENIINGVGNAAVISAAQLAKMNQTVSIKVSVSGNGAALLGTLGSGATYQAGYTSSSAFGQVIHVAGQHGLVMGYAGGGIVGGVSGTDANLAALTAGEAVLTARAVAALGGPLGVHSLNNQPSHAVLTGSGGGSGVIQLNMHLVNELDGRQMTSTWRSQQLNYHRLNPSANVALRTR